MNADPKLDPDIAEHLAHERAFDGVFAWPPLESVTETRQRFVLQPWSIDRESAVRSLVLPSAGDNQLETALIALWLAAHDDDAITLLRIQSLARQYEMIRDWCRANVLPSERDALQALVDAMFKAADENKTLPAHEWGGSSGKA